MRSKTFVWLALCCITAFSVGLMVLAILFYDNQQFDKSNDFEDDSLKMITKSENSFILFYSLEDPNFGFQNSWQSFRMKIQDWNKTNIVYVGKIECSVFRSTCLSFRVDRYPTIAWIKNGKVVEEYVGDDISESIKKFFDKLVTIVTEQKATTVQEGSSSGNILQGGSFDIIRRFIEGERGQNEVSTASVKTTEATTTVNYQIFNSTIENKRQDSSNSSTTLSFETFKTTEIVDKFTVYSNKTEKEQIEVSTTERTNITDKIEKYTKFEKTNEETFQEPDAATTIAVSKIPDFTSSDYENQTEASSTEYSSTKNSTSIKIETTTVDESSSESIIMTRPTETQSSEQKSSKENVESNKNESDEDESPEDDDPFGLGGLFGNTGDNEADNEEESERVEDNDAENEDDKESEETSKPQKESSETEEQMSTKSDQENNETTKSKEKPKTTKYESESEEYKKTLESKVRKDISTKLESTTKRSHYSKKKSVYQEKSKTTKYKSEMREYKQKSKIESTTKKIRKLEEEPTTKQYQSSKEEEDCKNNRCKKNQSQNKEHNAHRESSKHK